MTVLVVGAGPAGATAARPLARAGVTVRLLDRSKLPEEQAVRGRNQPPGAGYAWAVDDEIGADLRDSVIIQRYLFADRRRIAKVIAGAYHAPGLGAFENAPAAMRARGQATPRASISESLRRGWGPGASVKLVRPHTAAAGTA